jgi:hypothetical protein
MSNNAGNTLITNRPVQLWNGLGILFAPAKEIKLELKLVMVIGRLS